MAITGTIERGSVIWLNMHPTKGHEQHGWRAAIILSDSLIDPDNSSFAMVVPVTTQEKQYPFEVKIPSGITTEHERIPFKELTGVVLTDQAKSLDLNARDAVVIGKVNLSSSFYNKVITNVRSILA